MNSTERREKILKLLQGTDQPVSASALAKELEVSRQIVVGDVALLRSSGKDILATPRGYLLDTGLQGIVKSIVVCHGAEETESELNAIVDNGCTVLNVIVEHPVYGEITGPLHLQNRYEVQQFLEKSRDTAPLSSLTGGIHMHTVLAPDEAAFIRVTDALRKIGVLYEGKQTENES